MFVRRPVFDRLDKELLEKEALVITGMRQVGKTTALKYLYNKVESKNKVMLDLENPLVRKIFEEIDYDSIWHKLAIYGLNSKEKAFLFLDEIQNLPEISRIVKYFIDHYQTKFVVTGSSSYYLKNLFPESLSGRKMLVEMFPLGFSEFLEFKGIHRINENRNEIEYLKLIPFWDEYMEFGGFPGVVVEENRDRKKLLLGEIFTSYFEIDVKSLADFENLAKFRDLILLLTVRIGSKLDIGKIASELKITRNTIYSYISFLEQTYFLTLLSKFSKSLDVQKSGQQKMYFCDVGLANFLGRLSEGQILEQAVFQNFRLKNSLSYFEKEKGSEIDFITDEKIGYEVKNQISMQDRRNFKLRLKSAGLEKGFLIGRGYNESSEVLLVTEI